MTAQTVPPRECERTAREASIQADAQPPPHSQNHSAGQSPKAVRPKDPEQNPAAYSPVSPKGKSQERRLASERGAVRSLPLAWDDVWAPLERSTSAVRGSRSKLRSALRYYP